VVELIAEGYPKGVHLNAKAMKPYERGTGRLANLMKWFITIFAHATHAVVTQMRAHT
jgi:hypothetical protein